MLPSGLLALLTPEEREALSSGLELDPATAADYPTMKTWAIRVLADPNVLQESPWSFRKELPLAIKLRERAVRPRNVRVFVVRRVPVVNAVGRFSYRFRTLPFRLAGGVITIDPVNLSLASSHLTRVALGFTSKPAGKVLRASSLRASPELRIVPFNKYTISDSGSTSSTVDLTAYSRYWTGTRTPNFKSLKRKDLPENPHTVDITEDEDAGVTTYSWWVLNNPPDVSWSIDFRPYRDHMSTMEYGGNVSGLEVTPLRNRAIARLADKSGVGVQNLAETVATANKTFALVGNNLAKIAYAARSIRRGNFALAAKWLSSSKQGRGAFRREPSVSKSFASNWLEAQYGWKPLINDIYFAIDRLSREHQTESYVASVSASAKQKRRLLETLRTNSADSVPTGIQNVDQELTVRYKIRFSLSDPTRALLAQTGFLNPISLAWELLPLSFVVDWVLPIGPWLEGFTQWQGLKFHGGTETVFRRTTEIRAVNFEIVQGDASYTHTFGGQGHRVIRKINLSRERLLSFPSASFPSFKNPFSTAHAANALALLRSQFRR